MIWTTKLAIVGLGVASLAGGGALLATTDRHPVVNVAEMRHSAVPGPQHDLVPMQSIKGVDYDAAGNIISARIDGLEQPASAAVQAHADQSKAVIPVS